MIYGFLFLSGGFLYMTIELFWRGRSHASMAIAGGAAFTLLYGIFSRYPALPLTARCLIGSVLITAIEFITGAVVNVRLGLRVWDYSAVPMNLYGQICLRYSVLWFLLTVPASILIDVIRAARIFF